MGAVELRPEGTSSKQSPGSSLAARVFIERNARRSVSETFAYLRCLTSGFTAGKFIRKEHPKPARIQINLNLIFRAFSNTQ